MVNVPPSYSRGARRPSRARWSISQLGGDEKNSFCVSSPNDGCHESAFGCHRNRDIGASVSQDGLIAPGGIDRRLFDQGERRGANQERRDRYRCLTRAAIDLFAQLQQRVQRTVDGQIEMRGGALRFGHPLRDNFAQCVSWESVLPRSIPNCREIIPLSDSGAATFSRLLAIPSAASTSDLRIRCSPLFAAMAPISIPASAAIRRASGVADL